MSQDLHFYKQKILPEEEAQEMKQEEVYEKIKSFLEKYDVENQHEDLRELFFEEVEVSSINISSYTPGIKEFLDSDVQFIPQESRRFIMDNKVWVVIEKIIVNECSKIINPEKNPKSKSNNEDSQKLAQLSKLLKDFSTLKELFKINSLIVNIQ
ncbi:hypothetical protein NDI40_06970 [Microcoleus vaginatus ZQ-A3]|uniref:hypothetical protein n=1 Tax=Microcoleus vaginatus TaxID=119532 RepID=UPI001687DF5B|nr:hypothetical protein [Microcoleus sp. FACHB-45]